MKYKIALERNKNGKWFWKLLHGNGKILAHSEWYSNKTKASTTAKNVFNSFKMGKCVKLF